MREWGVVVLSQPAALDQRRCGRVHPTLAGWCQGHVVQREEQLIQRQLQCVADVGQCLDRWVGQATLNGRDVGPVHQCFKGQRFL